MGGIRRVRCDVDVTSCGVPGLGRVAATVVVDEGVPAGGTVAVCFPGGGMNRHYFDLRVPAELGGYSMAAHLAGHGHAVVSVDHPGIGDSDVPDDPWRLTPRLVSEVDALAVTRLTAALAGGSLAEGLPARAVTSVAGVGHSMGAMLVAGQQAAAKPYDAVALLGFSGYGLPEVIGPQEAAFAGDPEGLERVLEELTRNRFGRPLAGSGTTVSEWLTGGGLPEPVLAAAAEARAPLLTLCGLTSLVPGSFARELSALTVPVFIGVGEHDIVGPADRLRADVPSAADVTVLVVPRAAHNHNVAPTRTRLWDALSSWLRDREPAAP